MSLENFLSDYPAYLVDFSSMSDSQIGKYHLATYVDRFNSRFARPPIAQELTLGNLLIQASTFKTVDGGETFADGFGFAIRTNEIATSTVYDSFDKLLDLYTNELPNQNEFFSALSGIVSKPSPIGEKVVEVYENVKDAAVSLSKKVVDGVSSQINFLSQYGLYVGIIIIALVIYFKVRKK